MITLGLFADGTYGGKLNGVDGTVKGLLYDDVKDALDKASVHGMTVTEVKGYGRQKGHVEMYRGAEYQVVFKAKVKVEVVVNNAIAADVVEAMRAAANTCNIGDGKIFVIDVEDAVRIRTNERGEAAV
jgi:nitrogen regulatory protein P-II 1